MVVCIVCVCVCGRVRTSLQLSSNPAGRLLYLPTVAARLRLWCFVLLWLHLYRRWWSATADARGRDGSLRVSANVRQRKWRRRSCCWIGWAVSGGYSVWCVHVSVFACVWVCSFACLWGICSSCRRAAVFVVIASTTTVAANSWDNFEFIHDFNWSFD